MVTKQGWNWDTNTYQINEPDNYFRDRGEMITLHGVDIIGNEFPVYCKGQGILFLDIEKKPELRELMSNS